MGDVIIVRDTRGSLMDKQAEIVAEAVAILSECRPTRTIIIDCDAQVHQVVEIGPGENMPTRALGGGGTDFRPVFTEVTKRQYQPEVMVFVTDLFGDFPDAPPGYPVLWALVGACNQVPPWGSHVVIEP
jgi:predicted metal-dependent peptidase